MVLGHAQYIHLTLRREEQLIGLGYQGDPIHINLTQARDIEEKDSSGSFQTR